MLFYFFKFKNLFLRQFLKINYIALSAMGAV